MNYFLKDKHAGFKIAVNNNQTLKLTISAIIIKIKKL